MEYPTLFHGKDHQPGRGNGQNGQWAMGEGGRGKAPTGNGDQGKEEGRGPPGKGEGGRVRTTNREWGARARLTWEPTPFENVYYSYQVQIACALTEPFPTELYFKKGTILQRLFSTKEHLQEVQTFGDGFQGEEVKEKWRMYPVRKRRPRFYLKLQLLIRAMT